MKKILYPLIIIFIIYCNNSSPEKLWENVKVMRSENNLKDCIINIESIINNYPDHDLAARAQYQKAEIYLNDIKDFDFAIEEFEVVISQYPNHEVRLIIHCGILGADAKSTYENRMNKFWNMKEGILNSFQQVIFDGQPRSIKNFVLYGGVPQVSSEHNLHKIVKYDQLDGTYYSSKIVLYDLLKKISRSYLQIKDLTYITKRLYIIKCRHSYHTKVLSYQLKH